MKDVSATMMLLLAFAVHAAPDQQWLREEIIEHTVDPCYRDLLTQDGLTDIISDSEAFDALKTLVADEIDDIVNSTLPTVSKMELFSDRKAVYEFVRVNCVAGGQ